jgi:predicted dehydrogenase
VEPAHVRSSGSVRIGVLGCGYWGSKHARVLTGTSGVRDVVLIDSDPATHERLKQTFGYLRRFHRLEQALPYIDALMVATPPSTHAELAIAAMRHEKHVLVEKPLATSVAEACAMIAQARQSNCGADGRTYIPI